jgi:hypothetical protein
MWLCHFPEVPVPLVDVAYWGKTGRHLLAMSSSQFDPLRKSGGPKCCDAQHGFFNDVVGCFPRLEEST